jgi:histone-lysine N-methyltransferase SETMAR
MEWRRRGEHCPVKAKMRLSAGKGLTTIFWDWKGVLLIDFLHECHTVNAAYYCQHLDNVKAAYKTKRCGQPIRNVILLHDNARPHTAILTWDKLKEFQWETLEQPPYSPDLSPTDYHLFRPLKEALGGHRFQSDDGVEEFVRNWAVTHPPTFYEEGIQKLPTCWQKCVELQEDHVEKQ